MDVQDRCVNMLARLFNAPKDGKPTGTSCVGSSEGASSSLFIPVGEIVPRR